MFILVIAPNPNVRRFCVDNLVVRGHLAVGVASVVDEGKALLESWVPRCAIMCNEPERLEPDLMKFRTFEKLNLVPIIIISREKPAPEWMATWNISAHIRSFPDTRYLVEVLKPWIVTTSGETLGNG